MPAIEWALAHPSGGLKHIPTGARRLALLNQADTLDVMQQADVRQAARRLLAVYDAVALSALAPNSHTSSATSVAARIHAVYEPAAAIVLAAGAARRMGAPKLLLPWQGEPVIRATARLALASGAQQAIVVTGSHAAEMERALDGLPVQIVHNPDWQSGQAASLAAGLRAAAGNTGAALFLLGDQPRARRFWLRWPADNAPTRCCSTGSPSRIYWRCAETRADAR
jgi:molybdenum cofactor cytidylyltransferase